MTGPVLGLPSDDRYVFSSYLPGSPMKRQETKTDNYRESRRRKSAAQSLRYCQFGLTSAIQTVLELAVADKGTSPQCSTLVRDSLLRRLWQATFKYFFHIKTVFDRTGCTPADTLTDACLVKRWIIISNDGGHESTGFNRKKMQGSQSPKKQLGKFDFQNEVASCVYTCPDQTPVVVNNIVHACINVALHVNLVHSTLLPTNAYGTETNLNNMAQQLSTIIHTSYSF